MPSSKTYTQNINRSKLQLKTIFKPQKKEPKNDDTKPKISKKEVFNRIGAQQKTHHIPKPENVPQNITQTNNIHEKRTLIFKIQKYQNSQRFGSFVRHSLHINQSESQLNKLNLDQLNDILAKIRLQLDNKNLDTFYNSLIEGGCNIMENVLNPYYNIDGYGKNLISNHTFMDALERYKIENPFPSISPSIQLSYAMISTLIMTHELNKRGLNTLKKPNLPPPVVEMKDPNVE